MLRVNVSASANQAKSYYAQGLSRQDYYARDHGQEIIGRWHGEAAALLGLHGEVDRAGFFALAENRHPLTGETLTARQKTNRRVGYDFTYSAPKSVALLYAWTGDRRILHAFEAAVDATMREMETEMKTRVRRGGNSADRITGNMVWADFTHLTTRPVDGVPDPDLHAHCFAFNVTWDAEEERWKAGQFGDHKRDAAYYEAAFHARLAARMKMLGYGIERQGKWWDVAGVPRELIEKFSRRSAGINAKAAEAGITDAGAKSELGARTRERKALDLSMSELKSAWWNRLTPEERVLLEKLADGGGPQGGPGITPQAALAYAIDDVYARASVASEKQLYEKALRRGFGHVLPETLPAAAEADPRLIRSEAQGRKLVTTRDMLKSEQTIIERVKRGRGTLAPLNREASDQPKVVVHGCFLAPARFDRFLVDFFERERDRLAVIHRLDPGKIFFRLCGVRQNRIDNPFNERHGKRIRDRRDQADPKPR